MVAVIKIFKLHQLPMQTVNVSSLKNNPSGALRNAKDDVVVVMNRDQPDAVLIGPQSGKILSEPGTRIALATALFKDGGLSLARSAKLAQIPLESFISHVSRLGIAVINLEPNEIKQDIETLDQWLASY